MTRRNDRSSMVVDPTAHWTSGSRERTDREPGVEEAERERLGVPRGEEREQRHREREEHRREVDEVRPQQVPPADGVADTSEDVSEARARRTLGGDDASVKKHTRVTANVAASTAYQVAGPIATATVPPAIGPMIDPNVQRNVLSDDAAASWSCGTSRGTIASRDGRCMPSAAANTAAVTNRTHGWGAATWRSRAA